MKVGELFSDAVRRSATPRSRATAAAWTSMSKRISVWSQTKPIGTTSSGARAGGGALADQRRERSGPIHGSGVRPALWNASAIAGEARSAPPRRARSPPPGRAYGSPSRITRSGSACAVKTTSSSSPGIPASRIRSANASSSSGWA